MDDRLKAVPGSADELPVIVAHELIHYQQAVRDILVASNFPAIVRPSE